MQWGKIGERLFWMGLLLVVLGVASYGVRWYCINRHYLLECRYFENVHFVGLIGFLLLAVGIVLLVFKAKMYEDQDVIFRHDIADTRCPECWMVGELKPKGILGHKLVCPRCGREWEIPDM